MKMSKRSLNTTMLLSGSISSTKKIKIHATNCEKIFVVCLTNELY